MAAVHPFAHDHLHHHYAPSAMSPPHGTKRPADNALDAEQPLAKRFDLLNLGHATRGARLHTPATATASTSTSATPPPPTDAMLVEDTPHRLYIHDLAAELAALDSDAARPVFLPDIEQHLARIPQHLLLGPPPEATQHNQVVLYNVPASLTLPEERDSVRKAIVEARQRIRLGQGHAQVVEGEKNEDADAMDLD